MAFVVDGSDWRFDGLTAQQIEEQIETVLSFVAVSTSRNEDVWIGDEFQTRSMLGDLTLWELSSEASPTPISGELFQELAAWLGRTPYYADLAEWPDGIGETLISIGEEPAFHNPDVAWVHHSVRSQRAVACLSLRRHGRVATKTELETVAVHFVSGESDRVAFWRDAIVLEGDGFDALKKIAPHAYPNLHFFPDVLDDLGQLGGGYLASRGMVQQTFAALSDSGHWVFTFPPPALTPADTIAPDPSRGPSSQLIEQRFRGAGLVVAPENPNVWENKVCREARQRQLGKATLYCEWHIKLEPHRNRIHIHGPVPESDDRVIVGIIREHLPLPG